MVPRHRLVDGQYFHLVLRAHLGTVQIDVVIAGAAAVGGRGIVIRCRRVGGDVVGNRSQAVRHARQLAEKLNEFGINALRDREIALEQLLGRLVVKLRIGAEEMQEIGEATLELEFVDDQLHLVPDALDLIEADPVNFVRRHLGCRVETRAVLVEGLAIRQ